MNKWSKIETIILVIGCLFFLQEPTPLVHDFPLVRRLLLAGISVLIFFAKDSLKLFFNFNTLPYISLIIYYLLAWQFDHGPAIELFAYKTIRVFPFFILGYLLTKKSDALKLMIWSIVIGQTIGAVYRLPFYLSGANRGAIAINSGVDFEEIQNETVFEVDTGLSKEIELLLYFFDKPYMFGFSLCIIVGLCLILLVKSNKLKLLIVGLLFPCILLVLRSQLTASIMALSLGIIIFLLLSNKILLKTVYRSKVILILIIILGVIGLIFLTENLDELYKLLYSGEGFRKILLLLQNFIDHPLDAINTAANKRLDRIIISWNAFLEHPVFGIGAYWGSKIWSTKTVIGAHSTLPDQLAQFGILGTIPMVYMFSHWFIQASRIPQVGEYKIYRICFICVWIIYFLGSFFDPLFGTKLDQYILLFAGISCGLKSLASKTLKKNRQELTIYQMASR